MQVQLRPARARFHPLMRRAGMRGLGLDPSSINPTTIWTPTTGYLGTAGDLSTALTPATYVPPGYVPVPACASGPTMFTQECIDQVLAAQQANMALATSANYDVFRANCETDWYANAQRYTDLGLPVPVNDCAQRTYGLTLPGTTGSSVALLPDAQAILSPNYSGPVYTQPPVSVTSTDCPSGYRYNATRGGCEPIPAPTTVAPPPATTGTGFQQQFAHLLEGLPPLPGGNVELGGMDIPWLILGAGALVLFMVLKK